MSSDCVVSPNNGQALVVAERDDGLVVALFAEEFDRNLSGELTASTLHQLLGGGDFLEMLGFTTGLSHEPKSCDPEHHELEFFTQRYVSFAFLLEGVTFRIAALTESDLGKKISARIEKERGSG